MTTHDQHNEATPPARAGRACDANYRHQPKKLFD